MTRNPFVDRLKVINVQLGAFQAAKTQAETFLKANDDKSEIDEVLVRAAVLPPVSDQAWNEIKKDLGFL